MENTFDAIIIGAGIGGMTCGTLLANHGVRTLVLEQHHLPGGYVTSFTRKGFAFDVVHVLGGLRQDAPIEQIFSHLGVTRKIRFVEQDKIFRYVYPGLTVDCWSDLSRYEEELGRHFPSEQQNLKAYFQICRKVWAEIMDSYYHPNLLQFYSYPVRFPHLVRFQNKTFQEFLDQFFKDEKIKEILGSGWGYQGLTSSRISALVMIGMYMSFHTGGTWYPQGGYQALANALAACLQEKGGTLRLKTRVIKIMLEKGRAVGVVLENGEILRARHIISNADTKRTFLEWIGAESLPPRLAARIKNLEQSVSGLVVHLGVKMELPETLNCGCNMVFPYFGAAENQFHLAQKNEMEIDPARMGFGLSVSSLKDSGNAPSGHHALDIIYMPAPYHYQNDWGRARKKEYRSLKERTADCLIRAAENLIPGLARHTVVKEIDTPLTYERYTSATVGGWYDAALTPGQSLLNRPAAKTPIPGLYLTGAKTFLGPGMFGAIHSGLFTADSILKGTLTKGKLRLSNAA